MRDRLTVILQHQATLMGKFRVIEEKNGFNFHPEGSHLAPQDINSYQTQHELRRLSWCIQEELCEAADFSDANPNHCKTELIDALHFICEFMLTLGYWPSDLVPEDHRHRDYIPEGRAPMLFQTMVELGEAVNLLKNKPWKQTPRLTDIDLFKEKFSRFMRSFIRTCYAFGMDDQAIEDTYLGKHSENEERIATGV